MAKGEMTQYELRFHVHCLLEREENLWYRPLFSQNRRPQIIGTSIHLVGCDCLVTPHERHSQFSLIGAGARQEKHGSHIAAVLREKCSDDLLGFFIMP